MRYCKQIEFDKITGFKLGWSLMGPPLMTVYCYVFDGIMVDTGQSHMAREVTEIAERFQVKQVYLSHHHEDHSGNASAVKEKNTAAIFGHELTVAKMQKPYAILPYQKYVWGKTTPLEIQPFPETIETPLGKMLSLHTPGHSKDHTVFLLQDEGILFSGDLYLADRIKFFRVDEDIGLQIRSLQQVLTLDFDMLLCCHFPKLSGGKERIQSKLSFLEDFEGKVLNLREKGYSADRIFKTLKLREDYFTKYFCFGNVSMINGVRSVIRHHGMAGSSA
ncbi:MAG: MBL fold metallo-hydrolase [Desulfobacteraceae bacterium]|nr:MAG: MBL fold metallo-hydrolase [Desulfobacteraceae bacterium]